MDTNPGEKEGGLGYLLTQVSFLKQRITNAALKKWDITYIQFVILAGVMELEEAGKPVTQQTVSDERRLDKAMVSIVVKALIARGYLLREAYPTDKRAFRLILTDAGREKAMCGKKIARRVDDVFFKGIDEARFYDSLIQLLENNNVKNE